MLGYILALALSICCCYYSVHAGLQCYQCASTNATDNCLTDIKGMVNTSVGINKTYTKNCTTLGVGFDRCMILYKETKQKIEFFYRDCHNGAYFPDGYDSPLFRNMTTVNQTTCDVIKDSFVCYRSCNTSFCNGPQPGPCDFWRANNSYPIDEDLDCVATFSFVKTGLVTTDILCLLMASFVLLSTSVII